MAGTDPPTSTSRCASICGTNTQDDVFPLGLFSVDDGTLLGETVEREEMKHQVKVNLT